MQHASGGFMPGKSHQVKVYNHGDHRSLTETHRDGYCDRILSYEEVRALGQMALEWFAKNAKKGNK